jgi:hypothetical protein
MTTQNLYALTDLWNSAGTTFKGIALDVTDTASASGSLLMDLQVGGASQFSVSKAGGLTLAGTAGASTITSTSNILLLNGQTSVAINPGVFFLGNSYDLSLTRDAANTLAQRNGTNAQAFRVYGTFTDASNLRRLVMNMSAAGVAEIKPEGLGTGASGNVLHISGLPTANPGAGILWNNGGTVEVGT